MTTWIDVKDQLPKRLPKQCESKRVMVATNGLGRTGKDEKVTTGHYVKDENSIDEAERKGCWYRNAYKPTQGRLDVTHWQELPLAPDMEGIVAHGKA